MDKFDRLSSLNNYNIYGDTVRTYEDGRMKLVTTNNQYWILLRNTNSAFDLSDLKGKSLQFECDFECSNTVTFEGNVNNTLQNTSTNGKVSIDIPNDATAFFFSIKAPNTTIYVDNVRVYIIG